MHFLSVLLPSPEHFRMLAYWILFSLSFLESTAFIGLAIPGLLLFPFVGFLAATGFLDPGGAFWFCFFGASAGSCLSYFLGRQTGFLAARFRSLHLFLESGKKLLEKNGLRAICFVRLKSNGGTLPFLAGSGHFPLRFFLLFAFVCTAFGIGIHLLAGYIIGLAWFSLGLWSTRLFFFVFSAASLLGVFFLARTLIVRGAWPGVLLLSSLIRLLGTKTAEKPAAKTFLDRHRRTGRLISGRFDPDRFEGLPLTLLGLALLFSIMLVGGLAEDLLARDPIIAFDKRLAALLLVFRTPSLLSFFVSMTLLGNWQSILGGVVLFSLYLFMERKKDFLLPFLIAMGGCSFFTTAGKWLFHRQRPFDMTKLLEFSFPSGHSAYTACFYGFLAYYLVRRAKRRDQQVDLVFLWFFLAGLVAFSRLYLGVHYLSDVLAGWALGLSWLLIGISLAERRRAKRVSSGPSLRPPVAGGKRRPWGPALLGFWIGIVLFVAATYTPPYFKKTDSPAVQSLELTAPLDPFETGALPKFTESIAGTVQEPLSFMIMARDDRHLIQAFEKAGWVQADPVSAGSLGNAFRAAILNQGYTHAPVTPSFWKGAPLDFAFEKETAEHSVRQRHHARVWKTGCLTGDGSVQYVGTASFDEGINWLYLNHRIAPAIDRERQILTDDFVNAGIVSRKSEVPFVGPAKGSNFAGDSFFTDGRMVILFLSCEK